MKRPSINPFYVLLVVVGVLFVITACAYSLMTLIAVRAGSLPQPGQSGHELMAFLNRHGMALMAAEVAVLAVLTVAAIGLDHVRGRRTNIAPQDVGN